MELYVRHLLARTSKYAFWATKRDGLLENGARYLWKFLAPCKYLKCKYTKRRLESLECTHKHQVFLVASHYLSSCSCNSSSFSRTLFALKAFRALICRSNSKPVCGRVGVLFHCLPPDISIGSALYSNNTPRNSHLCEQNFTMHVDYRERGLIHPSPPTLFT